MLFRGQGSQKPKNVVGIDAYFQQSILGIVIIVGVAFTFDKSKVSMIKRQGQKYHEPESL